MGWLRYVEEVLWVAAPELVLATIVESTLATSCHLCVPFGCEMLLDGGRKLDQVDGVRSEDTKEEGSFVTCLHAFRLDVGHNNVVTRLVVMCRAQPQS